MDTTTGPVLRWLRALVLAGVAMATGVIAHVSAGGYLPSRVGLVALWLLAAAGVAPLLGRPASTLRVVVLLMAGQTFIHAALTASVGHRGDAPAPHPTPATLYHPVVSSATGRRTGSFFDQVAPVPAGGGQIQLTVPYWVQHLITDMTGPHALMALAHLAAAAALGLWLAAGERALWTVLTVTGRSVTESLTVLLGFALLAARYGVTSSHASRLRSWSAGWPDPRPVWTVYLTNSLTRRGPPAAAAS